MSGSEVKIKEIFLRRIKDFMYERNITFVQLGADIDINVRTIRRWFKDRSPKIESLVRLADYFGCSIDYLLGLNDTEFEFTPQSNKLIFTERFKLLKKSRKQTDARVSEFCHVGSATVCEWNRGAMPNYEAVIDLCKLFECSFEYIIGRVE